MRQRTCMTSSWVWTSSVSLACLRKYFVPVYLLSDKYLSRRRHWVEVGPQCVHGEQQARASAMMAPPHASPPGYNSSHEQAPITETWTQGAGGPAQQGLGVANRPRNSPASLVSENRVYASQSSWEEELRYDYGGLGLKLAKVLLAPGTRNHASAMKKQPGTQRIRYSLPSARVPGQSMR